MNSVKECRIREHITLSELSAYTGVSERHLRFIESGDRMPSLQVAKRIADCLHGTVDDIFLSEKCTKST